MSWLTAKIRRLLGITNTEATVLLPPETTLLSKPEFVPPNFLCGVEILNDSSTPMEFVVTTLGSHLSLSYTDSIRAMLDIHRRGGRLFPTDSPDDARRIADAMSARSQEMGHSLVCRAAIK
jgi:ATP-dependent Clp protease adapter protein ClpS